MIVDEAQLEEIANRSYAVEHLWCHRRAEAMPEMAALITVLLDERMSLPGQGRLLDEAGQVLRTFDGQVPAVLEFPLPPGCSAFTLELDGQAYRHALPAG